MNTPLDWPSIIGLCGTACIIGAYAYLTLAKATNPFLRCGEPAVIDAALRAYQAAGIPEAVARELARPLAMESMENAFRLGAAPALSGPIARGDMATVQRQQAAVAAWDPATGQLYQALVPPTTALAARKRAGQS